MKTTKMDDWQILTLAAQCHTSVQRGQKRAQAVIKYEEMNSALFLKILI